MQYNKSPGSPRGFFWPRVEVEVEVEVEIKVEVESTKFSFYCFCNQIPNLQTTMKILHVSDGSIYNYDGVSTYINGLLDSAGESGAELLVLTTAPLNTDKLRHVIHKAEVREFKKLKILSTAKFNFSLPNGMKKVLDDFDPDILWIHTIGPLGLKAAHLAKNKYHLVYTKHCFYGDLWIKHLKIPSGFQWIFQYVAHIAERRILKASDVALFHNNNTEKLISDRFFSRFRYIPPPLSEKFLNQKPFRPGHLKDVLTVGFCGRLDPEKSLEQLFEAVNILQMSYNLNNIRILLIGDGSEATRLAVKYPDVRSTVTGFVDEVIPYLDQLDAYVLSSGTETTSLSSLEAYSRGLPVFSTPVGYLGQNADKFSQIYIFNTAAGLASLIHEVFIEKKVRTLPEPAFPQPSVISYSDLNEMVSTGSL
jgi:glycosyltransferase involved in cell wall biosynthesis